MNEENIVEKAKIRCPSCKTGYHEVTSEDFAKVGSIKEKREHEILKALQELKDAGLDLDKMGLRRLALLLNVKHPQSIKHFKKQVT